LGLVKIVAITKYWLISVLTEYNQLQYNGVLMKVYAES